MTNSVRDDRSKLHPEAAQRSVSASELSRPELDYWIKKRNKTYDFFFEQSHVVNNLVLSTPATSGPSIAIASIAVAAVAEFSKISSMTIFASSACLIISSFLAFIVILRKNDICVDVVEHIDRNVRDFADGKATIDNLFYGGRHIFSGQMRALFISSALFYALGICGLAVGFALTFLS
ncbi:hypothetical protein [Rhodobacteraceae bacterium DSL-40]|uniref:hypothetical protein n=1 Tax=Amaricoccus sp. B4 TaxID=3368557 RepID=UPI0013A68B18